MSDKNPLNKDPISDEAGAHPVGTGIGAGSGALAGAAIGAAVAGPVGVIAGAVAGGVAGGLAGKEVGEAMNPTIGAKNLPDENPVGTGVGATAGAITGATLGSAAGPLGTAAGAAVGAVAGSYLGDKAEEKLEEHGIGEDDDDLVNRSQTNRIIYNNEDSTYNEVRKHSATSPNIGTGNVGTSASEVDPTWHASGPVSSSNIKKNEELVSSPSSSNYQNSNPSNKVV